MATSWQLEKEPKQKLKKLQKMFLKKENDFTANKIFLIGLLKKFEKELKKSGKKFNKIISIDLKINVEKGKIEKIIFETDNGIFNYEN